jgi:S-adenosylmethionine decarboxylase proenzyme
VNVPNRGIEISGAVANGSDDQVNAEDNRPDRSRIGSQFVVDSWGAPPALLRDLDAINGLAREIADSCRAQVLNHCFHHFEPTGGITFIAILSSSHVAIHTWPEFSYLAVDLFCCNTSIDAGAIVGAVKSFTGSDDIRNTSMDRPLGGST